MNSYYQMNDTMWGSGRQSSPEMKSVSDTMWGTGSQSSPEIKSVSYTVYSGV